MPTYEYQCGRCDHRFEKFQSITAAPVRRCPKCGRNSVKRLLGTGAGLIFKGSGFYITDYRDKSYADKAKAESGGDATSTDSKPAEVKATDAKATESKAADSKPAASTGEAKASPKSESKPAGGGSKKHKK